MLDDDQIALLVYNHVVHLSLLDHEIDAAFQLAHEVAARAFDPAYTRAGIDAARQRIVTTAGQVGTDAVSP